MPTVLQVITSFCDQTNLPKPSPDDLSKIGQSIANCFRHDWGIKQPLNVISETKFVLSKERNCRPFIVIDYPVSFSEEMIKIASNYYTKLTGITPTVAPKKRARKTISKPVASAKPAVR